MGSHRVALHLGEIAQDNRWEEQRSGRMMALHCRSRADPVHSSLGKRVPQTASRNAQLGYLCCTANRPNEPSKSRPTSSPSGVGQDPVVDLARREHIQQFWDSETDRARTLRLWFTDLCRELAKGVFCKRGPNAKTYGVTVVTFADPDFRRQVVHHSIWKHLCSPE